MSIHYTDPTADVSPGVDFLDGEQVRAWFEACELDKPWRIPVRDRFVELVATLPPRSRVLELGSGPGLLAECVLDRCANVTSYTLLDFSEHMLTLSRNRVKRFAVAQFVHADFKGPDWTQALRPPYAAVIAVQAIHEVRHKRHVADLYQQVRHVLSSEGMLAVCDGTPGEEPVLWRQSLYLTVREQLHAIAGAGFKDATLDYTSGSMVLVVGRVPGRRLTRVL